MGFFVCLFVFVALSLFYLVHKLKLLLLEIRLDPMGSTLGVRKSHEQTGRRMWGRVRESGARVGSLAECQIKVKAQQARKLYSPPALSGQPRLSWGNWFTQEHTLQPKRVRKAADKPCCKWSDITKKMLRRYNTSQLHQFSLLFFYLFPKTGLSGFFFLLLLLSGHISPPL